MLWHMQLMQPLDGKCSSTEASSARVYLRVSSGPPPMPPPMAATPDYPLDLGEGYVRPSGGNPEAQRWFSRIAESILWISPFTQFSWCACDDMLLREGGRPWISLRSAALRLRLLLSPVVSLSGSSAHASSRLLAFRGLERGTDLETRNGF